jgi:hypothetical protein
VKERVNPLLEASMALEPARVRTICAAPARPGSTAGSGTSLPWHAARRRRWPRRSTRRPG